MELILDQSLRDSLLQKVNETIKSLDVDDLKDAFIQKFCFSCGGSCTGCEGHCEGRGCIGTHED